MNIRQQLTEMLAAIREGAPVDTAKLAALRTQVETEEWAKEYAAEGERTRAEEKAAREREARRAQAATEARTIIGDTRNAVVEAHNKVAAALAELDAAVDAHNAAINDVARILNAAGYAMWNRNAYAPKPVDHPDFDESMHAQTSSYGDCVQVDNTLHRPIDAGYIALWAARNESGVWDGLNEWKKDRNTYPLEAPLSELAE